MQARMLAFSFGAPSVLHHCILKAFSICILMTVNIELDQALYSQDSLAAAMAIHVQSCVTKTGIYMSMVRWTVSCRATPRAHATTTRSSRNGLVRLVARRLNAGYGVSLSEILLWCDKTVQYSANFLSRPFALHTDFWTGRQN